MILKPEGNLCCKLKPSIGCWACGAMRCEACYYSDGGDLSHTHREVLNKADHNVAFCVTANVYVCGIKEGYLDIVKECTHRKSNEQTNVVPQASDAGRP